MADAKVSHVRILSIWSGGKQKQIPGAEGGISAWDLQSEPKPAQVAEVGG